jgi:hypothetical protein
MAAIKIQRFLGAAPKISPELLPDAAAQLSFNTKLYSGDLIPYRLPRIIDSTGLTNRPTQTLYGLRNPENDADIRWLAWDKDVDVVMALEAGDNTIGSRGRFYYTGDGVPKVSTYDLALTGSPPFPGDFYVLGLPLPEVRATATPAGLITSESTSYARDAANTATIVTDTPHGLRSGNIISVTGFTGDERRTFNVTNAEVTVINSTTITYFSPGDLIAATSSAEGRVSLAGATLPRAYVYSWITPWGEESIPSEPSVDVYIKEGQTVTVTDIPSNAPLGKNFIRGVRLYRTIVSTSGTDYFRLRTLWFPTQLARVSRQSNVVTVTMALPHNLIVKDRFKISGCTDTSFNITGGVVTEVVDRLTFKFAQTAANVADKAETAGVLYHDVAESVDVAAVYWGDGGVFAFVDDYDVRNLAFPLNSQDYDPPPKDLRGLIAIQNNIFAGFVGNKVYFTEPSQPHAWPEKYALTFESDIVAIASVSGYVVVLTEAYPYRISGSDPAIMTYARIDTLYPCLSKKSVVNMGYGVAYSTHGGIAIYDPTQGADLVTKFVHDWDTWPVLLDPASIVAIFYNGKYFASHSQDALIFERDDKIGGFFVKIRYRFDAAWTDTLTNRLYYTEGTQGIVYEWDSPTQPLSPLDWKSKVIVNQEYINVGAARVIADFDIDQDEIDAIEAFNQAVIAFNQTVWNNNPELGTVNNYMFNGALMNGDPFTQYQKPVPGVLPVVFRLWANKKLIFQGVVFDQEIFRLPSGYRSDTFEVGVSGSARVRAIHIGETPFGLRAV